MASKKESAISIPAGDHIFCIMISGIRRPLNAIGTIWSKTKNEACFSNTNIYDNKVWNNKNVGLKKKSVNSLKTDLLMLRIGNWDKCGFSRKIPCWENVLFKLKIEHSY